MLDCQGDWGMGSWEAGGFGHGLAQSWLHIIACYLQSRDQEAIARAFCLY